MYKLIINLVERLLRRYDYFLICAQPCDNEGHFDAHVINGISPEAMIPVANILTQVIDRDEVVKAVLFDAALGHLRRYEIDQRTFAQKMY